MGEGRSGEDSWFRLEQIIGLCCRKVKTDRQEQGWTLVLKVGIKLLRHVQKTMQTEKL